MTIAELMQKRAKLIADARALLDLVDKEKRSLTQEEENQYNALMTEVSNLAAEIDRRQKLEALENQVSASAGVQTRTSGSQTRTNEPPAREFRSRGLQGVDLRNDPEYQRLAPLMTTEYEQAFRSYLRSGNQRGLIQAENRALAADQDIYGGYLYAPVTMVDRMIQAIDNQVFIRALATIFNVAGAESLGAPSLDNDPADPTWTSELAIGSEDSAMSFGGRELTPHPLAKYIKVSRKLLRKAPDAEGLVTSRLGYKFGITLENGYMNGPGVNAPLGVFVASALGISTSRDVSTGNLATSPTFDGLIEAKFALKPAYWPRARWIFHRDAIKLLAKLKDGEGQYIWRESVRVGEPATLLGLPFLMSEYAPNTFTTGLYAGILGDFSYYWIADALQLEFQRLVELYAGSNQVGFIGRLESDGMPVLEEAFVRVKLA